MKVFFNDNRHIHLKDLTLILPAVSVGNVGQLTIDLLLNNLDVQNVAYIHGNCFVPIAGPDPFESKNSKLTTSCQLYVCERKKLAIIQHRSPITNVTKYLEFLVNFVKEHGIKRTVLLTSTFSQFFTRGSYQRDPIHYLSSEEEDQFTKMGWTKYKQGTGLEFEKTDVCRIPGGGVAQKFVKAFEKASLPFVMLVMICSEGDNCPEAMQMVDRLETWLKISEGMASRNENAVTWQTPVSWNLHFGNSAPSTLY